MPEGTVFAYGPGEQPVLSGPSRFRRPARPAGRNGRSGTSERKVSRGEVDGFAEGGIRLDRVAERLDRDAGADGERELSEPLPRLRADGDRAAEHVLGRVGEQADEAG